MKRNGLNRIGWIERKGKEGNRNEWKRNGLAGKEVYLSQQKVQVTRKALIQRINRHLAKSGKKLKKARTKAAKRVAGEFFIVGKKVMDTNVDLNALGRELGVLAEWETLQ